MSRVGRSFLDRRKCQECEEYEASEGAEHFDPLTEFSLLRLYAHLFILLLLVLLLCITILPSNIWFRESANPCILPIAHLSNSAIGIPMVQLSTIGGP